MMNENDYRNTIEYAREEGLAAGRTCRGRSQRKSISRKEAVESRDAGRADNGVHGPQLRAACRIEINSARDIIPVPCGRDARSLPQGMYKP